MFINGVLLTELIFATFALTQMRYSSVWIEVESLEVLNNRAFYGFVTIFLPE